MSAVLKDDFAYSTPLGVRPDWQRKNPKVTTYQASYTCSLFHLDNTPVRGLIGPIGSGKSVACCWEIMARAVRMPKCSDGIRHCKVAVVRNTYRELKDTTIATWLDWFPEVGFGRFNKGDMTHEVRMTLPDGSRLELDVVFRALDKPSDVAKLLGAEYTFAWINEARELPHAVVIALDSRLGRYPSFRDESIKAAGGYWVGLFMDTNPPDEDHWWFRIFENERPDGWKPFHQPGGRTPKAENLENLRPGYYQQIGGKSPEWIKVYFDGEYGFVMDGKPVYSEYTDSFHCTDWARPMPGVEIRVGMDFGLTPAAVFVQQDARGRWRAIDELATEDMGAVRFAELLNAKIQGEYSGYSFRFFGDPAGDQRAQTDEQTPFKILAANGIHASPARSNDFNIRREAVAQPLMRIIDGKPGLSISPKCKALRKGMAGKYCYRRVQVLGDERYHDKPDKGAYSHVCEALQYVMLEFGSNPTMSRTQQTIGTTTFQSQEIWSPFDSFAWVPTMSANGLWLPQRLVA